MQGFFPLFGRNFKIKQDVFKLVLGSNNFLDIQMEYSFRTYQLKSVT